VTVGVQTVFHFNIVHKIGYFSRPESFHRIVSAMFIGEEEGYRMAVTQSTVWINL
jgi:hypothetical protein